MIRYLIGLLSKLLFYVDINRLIVKDLESCIFVELLVSSLSESKTPGCIKCETVGSHFSESELSLRRLAVGVTVFKSAVGSARGGNKAWLARPSVARALETLQLSYTALQNYEKLPERCWW